MARPEHNPELVKKIQESFTGENGRYQGGKSVYDDNLPDGLTPDVVKQVSNYTTEFVAAGMEAAGNIALQAMKKDKKLQDVEATLPMGAFGEVDYQVRREKEVQLPFAKEGEPTSEVQYGTSHVKVSFHAGRNSGLLSKVRKEIKANAAEIFGKK